MQRIRMAKNAVAGTYSRARQMPHLAATQIGKVIKMCNAIAINV